MAQQSIEEALKTLRNANENQLTAVLRRMPLGDVPEAASQINEVLNTLGGHLENLQGIKEYVPGGEEAPVRGRRREQQQEQGEIQRVSYEPKQYSQEELHVQPGDVIRVPRGVLVETDKPGDKVVTTRRGKKVTVRHVTTGTRASPPTVIWYGSGGYKREADINDVEKLA